MDTDNTLRLLMQLHSRDPFMVFSLNAPSIAQAPIFTANSPAATLLCYSLEQLENLTLAEIDPASKDDHSLQTLQQGDSIRMERSFKTSEDKEVHVEADFHRLTVDGENVLVIMARNIEPRICLEKDLISTRHKADMANGVKQQFLANMSHELRTPLNGILGMTQILLGTKITETQREYLNLSLDAARHLTKVLNDLLSLSSVTSGGMEKTHANFDIKGTMEALVAPISAQAEEKHLKFDMIIADSVPRVMHGDTAKIRQILINLLFNAIKFTNQGSVTLEITTNEGSPTTGTNCTLDFAVSDTGIGIKEDRQQAIFESFSLGEDYMTKQYGGAGLGLSISRQLARFMGGDLTVKSEYGKGSIFTLTLPMECKHDIVDKAPRPIQLPLESPTTYRILLAEDEQVNSIMASRLLKKAGHSVTIVGNGHKAIETLSRKEFDLVLMDVQMPVVNGIEATKVIRSGAVRNVPMDLPIIGITAFTHASEQKQFRDAGMSDVVTKPYEAADLLKIISMVMDR